MVISTTPPSWLGTAGELTLMARPRVFISHCADHDRPTQFAARIIASLGCVPVIAEDQPSLARTVPALVQGTMDSCAAVMIIATRDARRGTDWEASSSVVAELTTAQSDPRWKGRYFVVKEKGVVLSPLNPIAYRTFTARDVSPIAEAILLELSAMQLFSNYYAMSGSEYGLAELADVLAALRDLQERGVLQREQVARAIKDQFDKMIDSALGGN